MPRPPVRWPTAHLDDHLVTAVEDRATGDVVPSHRGSGPLSLEKYRLAKVRIAVDMLTQIVEDLEGAPQLVRQAATQALTAGVDLQTALLTGSL